MRTHDSIWDLPTPTTTSTPTVPTPMPEPAVDQSPYRTALLTLPIRTPTPTPAPTSSGIEVIEEWPALPGVCYLVSSLINTSSTSNTVHVPTITPSSVPVSTISPNLVCVAPTSTSTSNRLPTSTSTSNRVPTSTSTSNRLPTSTSTSHRLPTSTSTSNRLPTSTSTSNRLPTSTPTSNRLSTSLLLLTAFTSPVTTTPIANTRLFGGGVTVYSITDHLHQSAIVDILTDPDTSRTSDMPPAKPKGNEVYLIGSDNHDDWKCDQYQWLHYGSKSVTINSVVLEKKFYKIRLPGSKGQTEGRGRNRAVGSLQFKRTAYNFKDNRNLVLVHYEGDETVYTPLSHGNVKNKMNPPEFIRTAPSVLQTIEKEVSSGEKNRMCIEITLQILIFLVSNKVF
ncbi:unnamed protein product [Mytilus edulis]|uniref:Uncharacterized protein n=1 Tax=Mytilus edulis TaxID=6550 RepID=A0A8S3QY13_MYTED|nr:unnamed protein product [Mytilus edulis]